MNFAENLEHAKNFAIETAMAAKDKAVQLASIAKANIAIYAEEDKIRKAQQQLGQLYYRDYAVGEEMDSAEYLPWCQKIDESKKLIEELVQAEAQKNSAKMEAVDYKYRFLHTQINPHFIYNSLETINAIAKVNHTPEVSSIVQLIGKYFRNITKYSDHQFIALEKEFDDLNIL